MDISFEIGSEVACHSSCEIGGYGMRTEIRI
jgi:hypothetical protein